jgi:two-component system, chemotaxis family, protein-glutamate methylesterase/glutaminase
VAAAILHMSQAVTTYSAKLLATIIWLFARDCADVAALMVKDELELPAGRRNIIVIGASAGGVTALQRMAADLPPMFPAAILIVLHVGANKSLLPQLLAAAGPNSSSHVLDGERLRVGHLAVAPPDYHLLVNEGSLSLTRGPKENFARPAIDPLFRSAALTYGPRVIGVVLTGNLDDGTAGLQAIKECGGLSVIEDPSTAFAPSMPASAFEYVEIDYRVSIESMAQTLSDLVHEPSPKRKVAPPALRHEHAPQAGTVNAMDDLKAIAAPSPIVCPECGGGLWEISRVRPARFRCHTGHAYTLRSLEYAMNETTEDSLWAAVRALQERAVVKRRSAEANRELHNVTEARADETQADLDEARAAELRKLLGKL